MLAHAQYTHVINETYTYIFVEITPHIPDDNRHVFIDTLQLLVLEPLEWLRLLKLISLRGKCLSTHTRA